MLSFANIRQILRERGIQPSAQRLAIARVVLQPDQHPTAEEVWREVSRHLPAVSRATIYNSLNLFVNKGLLRTHQLDGGPAVFDANVNDHHHLVDEETGRIHDIAWDALEVRRAGELPDFEVRSYSVVMKGRWRRG